jgi:hypothetical protein
MNRFTVFALFLVASLQTQALADEKTAVRPITNAIEVFAVFIDGWGSGDDGLVMAIWDDGHIVWSENRIAGGPTYRCGKVDHKKIQSFLERIEREGFFNDKDLSLSHCGFDSTYVSILAKHKNLRLHMWSWHELAEDGSLLFSTQFGLGALDKRIRLEELKKLPAECLYYRTAWNELRLRSTELIPAESGPINGRLRWKAGDVYWEEWPKPSASEPKAEK